MVDVSPPTFTAPSAIVVEANGPGGAKATYSVTAADNGTPLLPGAVTCAPASGSSFPLGVTAVGCTAADPLGNVGTVAFDVLVRDSTPPTLLAADITVASTSAAGIRKEDPAMVAFLGSLRGTDLVSSVDVSTNAPDLFPVGVTPLVVRARDVAGNLTQRTVKVTVLEFGKTAPPPPDLDPPADVTALRAVAGNHVVTLSWASPTAPDLAAIEVRIASADGGGSSRVVARTLRSSVTLTGLRNGVEHRFVVVSIDKAGNESRGVVIVAVPEAKRLVFPKAGTKVRTPPLLRWVPTPNASYYNVQLFRGKTKVLSAWPTRTRLQLARTWTYDGARQKLAPGTYVWYVWPGFGARNLATYGELIGKSTFVVPRAVDNG
ncbi:MAG: HYR domain-containing protein [Gaiellales bacterium]